MNLWHVASNGIEYFLTEDGSVINRFRNRERAQQIANEHNAWAILMQRGWAVRKWEDNTWGIIRMNDGGCPYELLSYENNSHDTPVAAILAADVWLREMESGSQ